MKPGYRDAHGRHPYCQTATQDRGQAKGTRKPRHHTRRRLPPEDNSLMFPKAFIKGYDKGRLRLLLTVFFLALAIPTALLIRQAYSQLKWEAFHQYRGLAEELTNRIDARLVDMINFADASSFTDYTFLVVTGDPDVNVLQRSPLSTYPVSVDPPGLLGYFQVDTGGAFSSPLLPGEGSDPIWSAPRADRGT